MRICAPAHLFVLAHFCTCALVHLRTCALAHFRCCFASSPACLPACPYWPFTALGLAPRLHGPPRSHHREVSARCLVAWRPRSWRFASAVSYTLFLPLYEQLHIYVYSYVYIYIYIYIYIHTYRYTYLYVCANLPVRACRPMAEAESWITGLPHSMRASLAYRQLPSQPASQTNQPASHIYIIY